MGKVGVRLVARLPRDAETAAEPVILCPWLDGPDPATRFWLGVLSWHDANASLLAALDGLPPRRRAGPVFAALFCADPFRSPADLFARLRAAGIAGVVNLPSVTFLDGPFADILRQFDLGPAREVRVLRQAHEAGFRIAGCADSREMARDLAALGSEFLIVHDGPPVPRTGRHKAADPLPRRFAGLDVPVMTVDTLLAPFAGPGGAGR